MKSVAKSLFLAFMGTGLVFWLVMMAVVPAMGVLARTHGDIAQRSVVVSPALIMRTYGIPLAVVAFVVFFAISMYRFHKQDVVAAGSRH